MNKSPRSSASWASVESMLRAAEQDSRLHETRLQKLLDGSNQILCPFRDPLWANVGANRWLAKEREEAYSDWLAWILEQLSAADVLKLLRIMPPEGCRYQSCRVEREWRIPPYGRLDFHISLDEKMLIIIEVKKTSADEAELEKQKGYGEWAKKQRRRYAGGVYTLFLAIGDSSQEDLKGFEPRTWEDLCIDLRRMLPWLTGSLGHVTTAMFVAFIAAVERNLLKLVPTGQSGQIEKLMYARTADHVEKALLKEGQGGVDMNKAESDSARALLIEGASSYPLAATAFDQFTYKVHELCDDVIRKDINKISAALGFTARPEDFEECPRDILKRIRQEEFYLGREIRRDRIEGWNTSFGLEWSAGKVSIFASTWFTTNERAKQVDDALQKLKVPLKFSPPRVIEVLQEIIHPGELEHFEERLEQVIDRWSAAWKQVGSLKKILARLPKS